MKYIEELKSGDTFSFNDQFFLLSSDFKKDGKRSAISFENGFAQWFRSDEIVNETPIFYLDENNNTIPIKYVPAPSQNIR
jgi:hypothetical protein